MGSKSHKDPKDRAHVWERATPDHELPAAVSEHSGYDVELPRYLHKHGAESIIVRTPDEYEQAIDDGYEIHLHVSE